MPRDAIMVISPKKRAESAMTILSKKPAQEISFFLVSFRAS